MYPEDGQELRVEDEISEGFTPPDLDAEPQLTAPVGPDIDPEMFGDVAKKLFGKDALQPRGAAKKASSNTKSAAKKSPKRR